MRQDKINIEPTEGGYKVGTGPLPTLEEALEKRERMMAAQRAEEDRERYRSYMQLAAWLVFIAFVIAGFVIGINL